MGEGAPLTLADVFLGLGSGLGGAGFCKDKLNYTITEKDNPQDQKARSKTAKDNSPFFDYDSVHLKIFRSIFSIR